MSDSAPPPETNPPAHPIRYNQVYEKLVTDEDDLVGMIAYALYKQSKRAWIIDFEAEEGRPPQPDEIFRSYVRAQGAHELDRLRSQAEESLATYSGVVLENERPKIRAEAVESTVIADARALHAEIARNTRWYKAIFGGVASAFSYSLLLIAVVLIVNWFGIDVLAVLERAHVPSHPAP